MACAGLTRPAVFVSGFWRSGTTWLLESLAEALGAKTVFEPLSPSSPARRVVLRRRFGDDEDAAQTFIPRARTNSAMCCGCSIGPWLAARTAPSA